MMTKKSSVKALPNYMEVFMDTGNLALNSTLDGVLKISGVGAAHAATQETYSLMRKVTSTGRRDIEKIVVKAGKEGLQWGMVAGMYAGFAYGIEKARGKQDWNAAVGGALTGVILSVSDGRMSQDKMVRTALTASALATAADFLKIFQF
ncbi:outer envelope pore protein 16, chloroplastic isoform X2 [Physcomitrium patens]|uniref:outer envelope pore protein 16, chloroplastic isoform X2 n=1 Tax=Physcomitrium patens TaxID=3218 RepID=UPI000D15E361|nr:outer envelope pore protein 16, chloroplastic-like isoform X2 [Physcomitrium patens]|eukprot:XP_024370067.1 outer envelope pore protein 16, chloroplastic-like isoform X2 [Physcomitrella patens]